MRCFLRKFSWSKEITKLRYYWNVKHYHYHWWILLIISIVMEIRVPTILIHSCYVSANSSVQYLLSNYHRITIVGGQIFSGHNIVSMCRVRESEREGGRTQWTI